MATILDADDFLNITYLLQPELASRETLVLELRAYRQKNGFINSMKKRCHACGEEISENAKVCRHCSSMQWKPAYYLNAFTNPGTLAISLSALLVSFAALYFSRVKEPANPKLVVQVDRFNETGFSFFVANLGELSTVVRHIDLEISLNQGKGAHSVKAGFAVGPSQIPPGENRLFQIDYSSFLPRHTGWTTSESTQEPFTLNFLYTASSFGNNLHCEVDVFFTSRRYFPSNIDGAEGAVNGTCFEAMKWFAENIGPLKVNESSN